MAASIYYPNSSYYSFIFSTFSLIYVIYFIYFCFFDNLSASVCDLKASPSWFLLLWEVLPGSASTSNQAPYWLLSSVLGLAVILYTPLTREVCFLKVSRFPVYKPFWLSKSGILGACLPGAGPPGCRAWCEAQTSCSEGRTSPIVITILFVRCIIRGWALSILCLFHFYLSCYASFFFFKLIYFFISWRLITLQYCRGFCYTSTWISHGYTCIPHPNPPSHLPLHPIPFFLYIFSCEKYFLLVFRSFL